MSLSPLGTQEAAVSTRAHGDPPRTAEMLRAVSTLRPARGRRAACPRAQDTLAPDSHKAHSLSWAKSLPQCHLLPKACADHLIQGRRPDPYPALLSPSPRHRRPLEHHATRLHAASTVWLPHRHSGEEPCLVCTRPLWGLVWGLVAKTTGQKHRRPPHALPASVSGEDAARGVPGLLWGPRRQRCYLDVDCRGRTRSSRERGLPRSTPRTRHGGRENCSLNK